MAATLPSATGARRSTLVWAILIIATLVSWSLGINYRWATVLVLLVTFVKFYLVGMNFMELRAAIMPPRIAFSGLCLAMCTLLIVLYLVNSGA